MSELLAVADTVIVYVLPLVISVIWCSAFSMVAVILPPNEAAPLKVTKSLTDAPWLLSVTVMVVLPLVAAKVAALVVVARMGLCRYTRRLF